MITLQLLLLVAAFVVFAVAAFNVVVPKLNMIAMGLALWILSALITNIR